MSLEKLLNNLCNSENYFKDVAKDLIGKSAQSVISCTISPANGKGANYSSVIQRIEVKYLDENSHVSIATFIVKIMPPGDRGKFMEKYNIFNHEIHVYEKILPKISFHLSQIGCLAKIAPKCVAVLSEPCAIVLEDLCCLNYKMLNRKEGLNSEQTMNILTSIAKCHAASVKVYEDDPRVIEQLIGNSVSDSINSFCIFYKVGIASLREEVEKWDGYEDIAQKLENFQDKVISKTFENYASKSSFNVLNHNDLWTNNFMFKYDEGKLINSVIIDYQFVYWGSPAIDLNFFLFTSVEDNVRKTDWNFLIHYYHTTLSKTLKDLDVACMIPKVTDIHVEMIRKGSHAIIACLLKAAVVLAPPDTVNVDLILADSPEGSDYRRELFSNPKYVEFIRPLIREFCWLGFLD